MVCRVPSPEVKYLAFEGGGGKGVAYMGVIKALEDPRVGILPIPDQKNDYYGHQRRQLKGVAGASAGAITALLIAMGMTSKQISIEVENAKELLKFFDDPANKRMRCVIGKDVNKWQEKCDVDNPFLMGQGKKGPSFQIVQGLYILNRTPANAIRKFLINQLQKLFEDKTNPILISQIAKQPLGYILNFLFEKGVFPGFAVREYFKKRIEEHFIKNYINKNYRDKNGKFNYTPESEYAKFFFKRALAENLNNLNYKNLTFGIFEDLTKLKFAVTGANIMTKRSVYFSGGHTNNFPVGEAIAISMNLPFIFKPIRVDYPVHIINFENPELVSKYNVDYGGLYVDGGVLNNLPIHYFDNVHNLESSGFIPPMPDPCSDLNKNLLGIRLTPPDKAPSPKDIGPFFALGSHVGDIMDSVMYPSEEGQIRNPQEKAQTIDIDTGELSVINFSPPSEKKNPVIDKAFRTVIDYFKIADKEYNEKEECWNRYN